MGGLDFGRIGETTMSDRNTRREFMGATGATAGLAALATAVLATTATRVNGSLGICRMGIFGSQSITKGESS